MTTPRSAASYDAIPDFGTLYDSVPAYGLRRDIGFYTATAAATGGPVLELGCGTGRILLSIARSGVATTGLDGSGEMLARLEVKLAAELPSTREHVTTQRADVTEFDLGRTFPLIIAPFRVFQQLTTIDEQLGCLESVARHLAPGGQFVFDVFNPYFDALVKDRSVEFDDTPEFTLDDGRTFRRTARVPRVRWTEQVSETELIYYLSDGLKQTRYVQTFDMRWYLRAELVHLLARVGLIVREIHGDFDRSALTDTSPEQVVVAEKKAD
jgi:SAM-dependent methyltransferase